MNTKLSTENFISLLDSSLNKEVGLPSNYMIKVPITTLSVRHISMIGILPEKWLVYDTQEGVFVSEDCHTD